MPFLERKIDNAAASALLFEGDRYLSSDEIGLPASMAETQRRLCGNAECAGGWTRPWKSRRRPVFEGQWGCSGRCVLAMVRSALHRETGDASISGSAAPHRHRVPLGLLLLAQGWITQQQLRQALEAQRQAGTGRIGEWLISRCGLEPEQITRGLGMQWNCPALSAEGFSPESMALVMPGVFAEEFGMLPLRIAAGRILYLAFTDGLDASAARAVEQMSGLKCESGILNEAEFGTARSRLLECESVEAGFESASDTDSLAGRITAIIEQKQPTASRLVRMHQYYWLRLWLEKGTAGPSGNLPVSAEDMRDYVFALGNKT
ncbi:MAG: hypothetical protein BGO25_17520 [Acidobacteriales bacterium 59-55]|nr:hypothetical protein [Terriglobales bacterium]OJV41490.1 MAG: hypothetical protein BGO25_17520 [Acidobacteriales bacterium 59-55]